MSRWDLVFAKTNKELREERAGLGVGTRKEEVEGRGWGRGEEGEGREEEG